PHHPHALPPRSVDHRFKTGDATCAFSSLTTLLFFEKRSMPFLDVSGITSSLLPSTRPISYQLTSLFQRPPIWYHRRQDATHPHRRRPPGSTYDSRNASDPTGPRPLAVCRRSLRARS